MADICITDNTVLEVTCSLFYYMYIKVYFLSDVEFKYNYDNYENFYN